MSEKPLPAAPRYRVDPETFPCERCAAKDAEIAEWSLKYAAEVVRANKAEESLKTAVTTTARTSKAILEQRDALRVRAEKAEAENDRLNKAIKADVYLQAADAEVARLRTALEKAPHSEDCRFDTKGEIESCDCWRAALKEWS